MISAIIYILLLAVVIFVVAEILPGVQLAGYGTGIKVAIVYSIIHFLAFKLLVFLALPFIIITLGLFILVINAFLLWLTDLALDDFKIDGIGTTLLASILISLGSMVAKMIIY